MLEITIAESELKDASSNLLISEAVVCVCGGGGCTIRRYYSSAFIIIFTVYMHTCING